MTQVTSSFASSNDHQEWSHGNVFLLASQLEQSSRFNLLSKAAPGPSVLRLESAGFHLCLQEKSKGLAERDRGEGKRDKGPFFRTLKLRVAMALGVNERGPDKVWCLT